MAEAADNLVLRRKAGAARAAAELTAMTPAKALRLALARAGDEVLETQMGLQDLAEAKGRPESLLKEAPDPALYLRLRGPDGGEGLAMLCPQAVAAVLEAQLTGKVLSQEAADRRPTGTDAIMAAGVLDQVLIHFGAYVTDCPDPLPVAGYLAGPTLADARAAVLTLDDVDYLQYDLTVDFSSGAKIARMRLLFPAETPFASQKGAGGAAWRESFQRTVLSSAAELEAVLCRMTLPLADMAALKPGDLLPLGQASLDGVHLTGPDGGTVQTVRLGRSGPMRAVRLRVTVETPPAPSPMPSVPAPEPSEEE